MFSPGSCWVFTLITGPSVQNLPITGLGKGSHIQLVAHAQEQQRQQNGVLCVPEQLFTAPPPKHFQSCTPPTSEQCEKLFLSRVTSHQYPSQKSPAFQSSQGIHTTAHPP